MNYFRNMIAVITMVIFSTGVFAQQRIESTSAEQRLKWYDEHVDMKKNSKYNNMSWQFVGPEVMSGRITDIAVPRGQKYTFYVAAASGGVWKTVNEGTTWTPIFEHAPSTSIGDIAVASFDSNVIWVGTGENNSSRSSYSGTGVYKSVDGGETWMHMGLSDTHHIGRIIVHPTNPNTVYVAAIGHLYTYNEERGVFKTTDGGRTWDKVLYVDEKTGIIDLVMDPSRNNTLYAAAWERLRKGWEMYEYGPGSGIYKTTNGGRDWEKLTNGLPSDKVGRIGIDVSKSDPNVVYALVDNHGFLRDPQPGQRDAYGNLLEYVIRGAEVYRSNDKGKTWSQMSPNTQPMTFAFGTYGYYFGEVRVDPKNPDKTHILGVPLLRSSDGGKTYRRVPSAGMHGDHQALWIDPEDPNYMISGNDGGINISYDGGENWKDIKNLGVVQFYNIAYDFETPFNIIGSIQDNGSWMGTVDLRRDRRGRSNPLARANWRRAPGGEASYHAIDPDYSNIVISEGFHGNIQVSDLSRNETFSVKPLQEEGMTRFLGNWLAPFIMSPHDSRTLYHGLMYLYKTTDRGHKWQRISPNLTYEDPKEQGDVPFSTLTSISESPLRAGLLYVGTDDGKVWVTKNDGKDWEEIMDNLPYKKWVSRVEASRYNEGTVYLAQNGYRDDDFADYLYKSTDYGKTWIDISGNIPGGPINVVHEDPKNENILYVGTDLGVYVTTDGGISWDILSKDLPTTFVHDLKVHPRDNILIAATHGRGIYVLDVSSIQNR